MFSKPARSIGRARSSLPGNSAFDYYGGPAPRIEVPSILTQWPRALEATNLGKQPGCSPTVGKGLELGQMVD